jgi:hypothetical protein
MNKVEKTTYRVVEFIDKNGEITTNPVEMTIMMGSGIKGYGKGLSVPFGMGIAKTLKLKVGDVFTETTTYERRS